MSGAFLLDRLRALAGRLGDASTATAGIGADVGSVGGLLEQLGRELGTLGRRLEARSAHLADDEKLVEETVADLEPRRPAERAARAGGIERPKGGRRPRPLTKAERHEVERVLRQFPDAGRPQIVQETGISDWRVRRFLAERHLSQAGGNLEETQQVAGGNPSPGERLR